MTIRLFEPAGDVVGLVGLLVAAVEVLAFQQLLVRDFVALSH